MYAKVYNLKFPGLSEAKVAATFCSENLGKKIVSFNIRSLNISIGQCGSVSISIKFESGSGRGKKQNGETVDTSCGATTKTKSRDNINVIR